MWPIMITVGAIALLLGATVANTLVPGIVKAVGGPVIMYVVMGVGLGAWGVGMWRTGRRPSSEVPD